MPQPRPVAAHLLSIDDLGPGAIDDVLDHAADLKATWPSSPVDAPLAGRAVALLFEKPSLRTRVSFEVGLARLGATAITMTGADVGLGSREPIADMARSLARYVDAIVVRMLSHRGLEELAEAAAIPVVNALTEREHPCQALADLLTMREHLGSLPGRQLVFVGDGNNVCHSLLLGGAAAGVHVRVAAPRGYAPDPSVVDRAEAIGRDTGARIELTDDPMRAVDGADAIYTDVWASMGSEDQSEIRRWAFRPFRVDGALVARAPHALVMHCLPAHRGEEIDADVLERPQSVAFDQAENRLYVQQAVLLRLLARSGRMVDRRSVAPVRSRVASATH